MKKTKLNTQVKIVLLSVMAFLLMYVSFPLPLFPGFLKIEISDLPALLGAFAFGPVAGVIIEFFKNVLHGFFAGSTVFVGELANFVVGSIYVLVAGFIYKNNKTKKGAIWGLVIGSLVMSISAGILNQILFLPLYAKALGSPVSGFVAAGSKVNKNITNMFTFIMWCIIPFNLIKSIIISVITRATYKRVSPILHKENLQSEITSKDASLDYK